MKPSRCFERGIKSDRMLVGIHRNPPMGPVPLHTTFGQCEKSEVPAHSDILARVHLCPSLSHNDISREHNFAVVFLDAETPARAVAPILRGALPFFVCHILISPRYQPFIDSILMTESSCRWPLLRRYPLRLFFLKTTTLSPLLFSIIFASTFAPST